MGVIVMRVMHVTVAVFYLIVRVFVCVVLGQV